jgi:hypothetical protein
VHPPQRLQWLLVLGCVALAALFGLACALDDDGDLGVVPCLAEDRSCAPDELSRDLPASDTPRRVTAPSVRLCPSAPGLLAAVPGGLCLLI